MQSNQSQDEISIQRFKQTASKSEIKQFMRAYQLKQVAIQELAKIYSRHIFTQHFTSTMKSAICLIVLPSLTNIYYTIRSHSILAGVMPFAVPLICLANYIYFLNKEMQQFSLTSSPDAALARNQYEIIYQYSYFDRQKNNLIEKLQNYRKDNEQNSVKRKDLI